jgi:hypothetical protein
MNIEVFNLDWNLVMYLLTSFVIGMSSMFIYLKINDPINKLKHQPDHDVVEAIVYEYTRRLQSYDKGIGELRFKIDKIELLLTQRNQTGHLYEASTGHGHNFQRESTKISQSDEDPPLLPHSSEVISHPKSQIYENNSHLATSTLMPNNITADDMISTNHDMNYRNQLSTPNLILNLLAQRSRTSREIQIEIGKTREHTSRLMRKLYQSNLVVRDDNSKPFKYHITETGRSDLMLHNAIAQTQANIRNPQNFPQ